MDELLLSTCETNKSSAINLFDWRTTNLIFQYKNGGPISHHSFGLIGRDYFIGGNPKEPKLYLWKVNSQEPTKSLRLILPEVGSCLNVCPRGYYLAIGIKTDLYIWQLASGKLLCIQRKNFQPISVIKFSNCGFYVIVGGHDGMIITYRLSDLVNLGQTYLPQSNIGQIEPLYTLDHHNRPITDICIGNFGKKSRFVTSSVDQTVKMFELLTGNLLLNLVLQNEIHAVIIDSPGWKLYVGGSNGVLQTFNLTAQLRDIDHHLTVKRSSSSNSFDGHNKTIKCLTLNLSGCILASGSDDGQILIWEVSKRKILKRIEQNSPITNLKFIINHKNILSQEFNVTSAVRDLNMQLDLSDTNFDVTVIQTVDIEDPGERCLEEQKKRKKYFEHETSILRARNEQLYQFGLNLLKDKKQ